MYRRSDVRLKKPSSGISAQGQLPVEHRLVHVQPGIRIRIHERVTLWLGVDDVQIGFFEDPIAAARIPDVFKPPLDQHSVHGVGLQGAAHVDDVALHVAEQVVEHNTAQATVPEFGDDGKYVNFLDVIEVVPVVDDRQAGALFVRFKDINGSQAFFSRMHQLQYLAHLGFEFMYFLPVAGIHVKVAFTAAIENAAADKSLITQVGEAAGQFHIKQSK